MRGITRPPAQTGSQGYSLVKPDRNTPQPRVFCLKQPIGFRNKIVLSGLKSGTVRCQTKIVSSLLDADCVPKGDLLENSDEIVITVSASSENSKMKIELSGTLNGQKLHVKRRNAGPRENSPQGSYPL